MADPGWFFGSLSQVTAAIVGFVGGFLVLRLHQLIQDWRLLVVQLQTARDTWVAADRAIEERQRQNIAVMPDQHVDESMKWSSLWRLIQERDHVELPRELLWGGLLLMALLVVGTLVPLWHVQQPSNPHQSWFLIPWAALVAGFGLLIYLQARAVRDKVKAVQLGNRVDAEVDQYAANIEMWEEQDRERRKT